MTRNIDYRVEVLCPILDPDAQNLIQNILDSSGMTTSKRDY